MRRWWGLILFLACAPDPTKFSASELLASHPAAKGAVRVIAHFKSHFLEASRDLFIYLPPNYPGGAPYPVVYFQDGNELFDRGASDEETWHLEGLLDPMIERHWIPPVVVVGIGNSPDRRSEYVPYPMEDDDGLASASRSDEYLRLVTEEVKPFIEAAFPVSRRRDRVFLAGASYGGLLSLHALTKKPEIFGGALVMSPALWPQEGQIFRELEEYRPLRSFRIYLDMGGREGGSWGGLSNIDHMNQLAELLRARANYTVLALASPGGSHDPASWTARLPHALHWLLN